MPFDPEEYYRQMSERLGETQEKKTEATLGTRIKPVAGAFGAGLYQSLVEAPVKAAGRVQQMLKTDSAEAFKREHGMTVETISDTTVPALEDFRRRHIYEDNIGAGMVEKGAKLVGEIVGEGAKFILGGEILGVANIAEKMPMLSNILGASPVSIVNSLAAGHDAYEDVFKKTKNIEEAQAAGNMVAMVSLGTNLTAFSAIPGMKSSILQKMAKMSAVGMGTGTIDSAVNQYARKGDVDLGEAFLAGAESGVMFGGITGLHAGASHYIGRYRNAVDKKVKEGTDRIDAEIEAAKKEAQDAKQVTEATQPDGGMRPRDEVTKMPTAEGGEGVRQGRPEEAKEVAVPYKDPAQQRAEAEAEARRKAETEVAPEEPIKVEPESPPVPKESVSPPETPSPEGSIKTPEASRKPEGVKPEAPEPLVAGVRKDGVYERGAFGDSHDSIKGKTGIGEGADNLFESPTGKKMGREESKIWMFEHDRPTYNEWKKIQNERMLEGKKSGQFHSQDYFEAYRRAHGVEAPKLSAEVQTPKKGITSETLSDIKKATGIDAKLVDDIHLKGNEKSLAAHGITPEDIKKGVYVINGRYFKNADFKKVIEISTKHGDPNYTGYHEAGHAVYEMAHAVDARKARILEDRFGMNEEAISNGFAKYMMDGKVEGPKGAKMYLQELYKKMKDFFVKTGNYLKGKGFQSVESIFGDAKSGKLLEKYEAKFAEVGDRWKQSGFESAEHFKASFEKDSLSKYEESPDHFLRRKSGRGIPTVPEAKTLLGEAKDAGQGKNIVETQLSVIRNEPAEASVRDVEKKPSLVDKIILKHPKLKDTLDVLKGIKTDISDITKWDDAKRIVVEYDARKRIAAYRVYKYYTDIVTKLPDKASRDAVYAYLDVGGNMERIKFGAENARDPRLKAAFQKALNLNAAEKEVVDFAKKVWGEYGAELKSGGILNELRKTYATHYVDWQKSEEAYAKATGYTGSVLKRNFSKAQQRLMRDVLEGDQLVDQNGNSAQIHYKTFDIAEALGMYVAEAEKVKTGRKLIEEMMTKTINGEKMVASEGSVTADGRKYVASDNPSLKNLAWDEEIVKDIGKYSAKDTPPDNATAKMWKMFNRGEDWTTAPNKVIADGYVHPDFIKKFNNLLGRSKIREWYESSSSSTAEAIPKKIVQGLDNWQQVVKATMLSGSPFHHVQIGTHAIGHRINPLSKTEVIDLINNAEHIDAVMHGLTVFENGTDKAMFMEGVSSSSKSLLNKVPVLGKYNEALSDHLFKTYIPSLKMKTYREILKRNSEVFAKDMEAGKINLDEVKLLSAQQANAAYGHLNYAELGRNPTIQHILQLSLLAPDFLEARLRFAGQALKGILGGKAGREQIIALGVLSVSLSTSAWVLAQLTGGEWDWRDPFVVKHGNRRYGIRSVPGDFGELFNDSRRFGLNRVNPMVGKPLVELISGVDWRNQKITTPEIAKEMAVSVVPLPIRAMLSSQVVPESARHFLNLDRNTTRWWEQLASATGLRIVNYSPAAEMHNIVMKYKERSGDPKLVEQYEREIKQSGTPSEYTPLRQALRNNDIDLAWREYQKMLKTHKPKDIKQAMTNVNRPLISHVADKKMLKELDQKDQRVYEEMMVERKLLKATFQKMLMQGGK